MFKEEAIPYSTDNNVMNLRNAVRNFHIFKEILQDPDMSISLSGRRGKKLDGLLEMTSRIKDELFDSYRRKHHVPILERGLNMLTLDNKQDLKKNFQEGLSLLIIEKYRCAKRYNSDSGDPLLLMTDILRLRKKINSLDGKVGKKYLVKRSLYTESLGCKEKMIKTVLEEIVKTYIVDFKSSVRLGRNKLNLPQKSALKLGRSSYKKNPEQLIKVIKELGKETNIKVIKKFAEESKNWLNSPPSYRPIEIIDMVPKAKNSFVWVMDQSTDAVFVQY